MADLYGTLEDEDEEEKDEEPQPAPKSEDDEEGAAVESEANPPGVSVAPERHNEATVASPLSNTLDAPPVASPVQQLDPSGLVAPPNARLKQMQEEGSGVSRQHGFGGALLKGLDVAGSILAPGIAAAIPGTTLNHRVQMKGELARENADLSQQKTQAEIENEKSKPELAQAKQDLAESKANETAAKNQSTREVALRKLGMKLDANGLAVPVPYEEMTSTEQAHHDLTSAQTDLTNARTEYEQTKADPNSPQNKQARDRLKIAAQNAATAAGKLGLDKDKYLADYLGVDREGNQIAGTKTDEETGKPVGVRVGKGNEATADRLKRSDLAVNVQTNTNGMREIINRRPDLFGKIAGRVTSVEQLVGSDDPDIARLGVAVHNAALASNGAHGVRSQEAIKETETQILNHFRNGPQATIAALNELDGSVQTFIDEAKMGKKAANSPNAPKPAAAELQPPKPADPGMKWQHRTVNGKVEWRQTKAQ